MCLHGHVYFDANTLFGQQISADVNESFLQLCWAVLGCQSTLQIQCDSWESAVCNRVTNLHSSSLIMSCILCAVILTIIMAFESTKLPEA